MTKSGATNENKSEQVENFAGKKKKKRPIWFIKYFFNFYLMQCKTEK